MLGEATDGNGRKLLEPGEMFGDYTVEKLLGKGGMGAVYLVHAPDGERYAVKLMFPDIAEKNADYRTRFAREAEFAMKLRHKNLITVYDAGEDPDTGYCYIIMDYMPGGSVKDRLAERGPLPVAEAISITTQIAVALELAHRHGVIHRDLKPDNIMFDADGTPKLADLGVAKFTNEAHKTTVTTTGMIIGTPAYMAPEQMMDSHHIDARADIYALGVVLYEMLTGKRPTEGSTAVELLAKALKGEPLPDVRTMRPEISAAIAHVLSLMCAPKPENRPPTTLAVAELLQKAATGRLVLPKKKPLATDAQRTKHPFPVAACILGVFVLGAAAFGWRTWQNRTGTTGVPPVADVASRTSRSTVDVSPVGGSDTSSGKRPSAASPGERPKPLVLDLGGGVKVEMEGCPAGTFTMGFKSHKDVFRQHKVKITRSFWMCKFPVTVEQWEKLMPPIPPPSSGLITNGVAVLEALGGKKRPQSSCKPTEVDEFMAFLNKRFTHLLPKGYVFRLPTWAEWEYACRANGNPERDWFAMPSVQKLKDEDKRRIVVSIDDRLDALRKSGVIFSEEEIRNEGRRLPFKIGTKIPNRWGFCDMIGNANELLMDTFSPNVPLPKWGIGTIPPAFLDWTDKDVDPLFWDSAANANGSIIFSHPLVGWGTNRFAFRRNIRDVSVGFRVVVGPDLLKERGITPPKPESSSTVASAAPGRGSGAPAASSFTAEKLPKETSPRPKPLVLDLGGGVKMEMVGCPSGKFVMGVKGSPDLVRKEHSVVITRPFWFGKYPVTVEQWERLMPHIEPPPGVLRKDVDPKLPIQLFGNGTMGLTGVSAEELMSKLTRMFERQLPRGYVFRLPTEAEWEYALKANSTVPYDPYANPMDVSGQVKAETYVLGTESKDYWIPRGIEPRLYERTEWFIGPYIPVGRKKPNAWGIYDMGGITSEPMLDSWVTTHDEWFAESSPLKRLYIAHARFPQVVEDGVRDPLIFEADKANAIRLRWARQGFTDSLRTDDPKDVPARSLHYLYYWFDVGKKQEGAGLPTKAVMLRLVVAPDLLKERGITPPKPDANGQDARSPSSGVPNIEPYKLLSERPKPLTIKLGKGEQLELMGCPAGTFTMGYEGGGPHHTPHKVTISRPFWAGKYPVTRAQWDLFMPPRKLNELEVALGGSKGAVSGVTRKEVDEYCRQLTKKYRRLLPQGYIFRLPTLAETEYFWRAGSTDPNDPYSKPRNLSHAERNMIALGDEDKKAMLQAKGFKWDTQMFFINHVQTPSAEVGLRKANAWGFFDLSGNVFMWVLDTVASEKSKDFKFTMGFAEEFDFNWARTDTDPLIWCEEGLDGTGIRWGNGKLQVAWGETKIEYIKPDTGGNWWLSMGFRLVAGPDLVTEKLSGKSVGAVVGGTRSITVFPCADTQTGKWKKRAPWRYTTKAPTVDWAEPGFRDGTWKRTNKLLGFGKDASFMRIAERWNTSDVWLRRHFTWKKIEKVTDVVFDMLHDEDVEIYLNGRRLLEEQGANADWEPFSVPVETFLSAVKEGDNVLAVKVHDSRAPRCFDCGLRVKVEDLK